MQKKVFIIILNWNGKDDTIECIKSIKDNTYKNYEIIVVDNGSEDDSVSKIKRCFPKVNVVENERNFGFAGGNNIGIRHAVESDADYILLINNDTTVDENFLQELVKAGELDNKVGILGPKIYFYKEPKKIWFAGGKVNWLKNKGTHIGLGEIDSVQYNNKKEVDYLTGCCLLVKREVVEKIGGLSEDYFLYYEDVDFSLRAKKAGYKCLYVPESVIYHKVSRSTKPGSPSYIYYHTRNGLVLSKRNGSITSVFFLYLYCILLSLKQLLKIVFFPQKKDWAFAVLKGEKDFLLGKLGK
jgi:hypothetical protein